MRLPRDIDATALTEALARLGCTPTRRVISHIRLSRQTPTRHSITVPDHAPIKLGTLNAILADVAIHQHLAKTVLIDKLFG